MLTADVVTSMKLYASDHKLVVDLKEKVSDVIRGITMQELLREAVHEGLPQVAARYTAAITAARKVK